MKIHTLSELRGWRAPLVGVVAAIAAAASLMIVPGAGADVPTPAETAFNAPRCAGQTDDDPTQSAGAVGDLTRVSGQRLTDYNAGKVVVLYDAYGSNNNDGYPALCGTRYVAGVGAVSEWMFCTDIFSHVCSGTDAAGNLLDIDGAVIPGLDPLRKNPRLTTDQEKLISWLIQNGHSYEGAGYYDWGTGTAAQDGNTVERVALQTLIWCISDPVDPAAPAASEQQRGQTCADSMSPAEQDRILAQIPDSPALKISLDRTSGTYGLGQTAEFSIRTNVYNQAIQLTTSATRLRVVSGPATYDATTGVLTVTGTDPDAVSTVVLGATRRTAGRVTLAATARPAATAHIKWNQSAGVAADGKPCQAFATFDTTAPTAIEAHAEAQFLASPVLVTKASTQKALVGHRLRDNVKITGFSPGSTARGIATLYGPYKSRAAATCRRADKVGTVAFTPANGTTTTPAIRVAQAGYYTWVAATTADSRNQAATHRCGLAAETTLVHKPSYGTPVVDTGFTGQVADPVAGRRSAPETFLRFPGLGIAAAMNGVAVTGNAVQVPANTDRLGLLRASAEVADPVGNTVVVGHVSDRRDVPGAFYNLDRARRGQVIVVKQAGHTYRFKVTRIATYSRADGGRPPASVFTTTGAHRLVLISCANKVVKSGRFHYTDNIVVTAKPIK